MTIILWLFILTCTQPLYFYLMWDFDLSLDSQPTLIMYYTSYKFSGMINVNYFKGFKVSCCLFRYKVWTYLIYR